MIHVYLERSEGAEHKFYEAVTGAQTLTLRYGRIGTQGTTQIKTFDTPQAAEAEAHKKLAEKRKKGYAEAVLGETEKKRPSPARIKLPKLLEPHREAIEATLHPVIELTLSEESLVAWDSKVGGVPYRLQGEAWPLDPAGLPLAFLAQINFAQLPALEGFPNAGIVQFFIGTNDLMGFRFKNIDQPQDTYRVLYFEQVIHDESQLDLSLPIWPDDRERHSPLEENLALKISGVKGEMLMTPRDRLFESTVRIDFLDEADSPDDDLQLGEYLEEKYNEISPSGHQLGGYPMFTQEDPRTPEHAHILLFQLDSDWDHNIMWGDMGIGNFFIHPNDLAKRDFSRVFYNWDCS
ncbi:DUF1963 domain-containing protein [Deinococcus psychrotolerans]|uniref:DUF1963 domain-containing protein n=1 Tax=Deinococcus psychrotolerans TaxID=2489213 RepID=A0A3G8Y958_9DEIO|nr:DUF1963 domain-containing protein [Deinococcus psychrotolerans]AZI41705.1 DUF1963 domain-containing protein [Deinococcus psychrotolerans]